MSACGNAGLVDEGMHCYGAMSSIYTISEELEHYTFMVDLLGCAGHLQETENMNPKLVPRPLDEGPGPKSGKLRLNVHGTCFGEKINWLGPKKSA